MLLTFRNCLAGKTTTLDWRTLKQDCWKQKIVKIEKTSWGAVLVVSFFLFVLHLFCLVVLNYFCCFGRSQDKAKGPVWSTVRLFFFGGIPSNFKETKSTCFQVFPTHDKGTATSGAFHIRKAALKSAGDIAAPKPSISTTTMMPKISCKASMAVLQSRSLGPPLNALMGSSKKSRLVLGRASQSF